MDRICIEGFPRSGNTYSQQLLAKAFPQAVITPFTHSARVLTGDHFVLIREPNVAISSFMSVFHEPNAQSSEQWWMRFYNTVLEKTNPKRWIFFDDLTQKTNETINRIGKITGLNPIEIDHSSLGKNSATKPYGLHAFNKAQDLYLQLKKKANE
jgi:hypothetical protein